MPGKSPGGLFPRPVRPSPPLADRLPSMGNEAKNASVTGGGGPRGADGVDEFIDRWSKSAGAERANYQLFLAELCDLIGVPRPDPSEADEAENTYVFDKAVTFRTPDGKRLFRRAAGSDQEVQRRRVRGARAAQARCGGDRAPHRSGTMRLAGRGASHLLRRRMRRQTRPIAKVTKPR